MRCCVVCPVRVEHTRSRRELFSPTIGFGQVPNVGKAVLPVILNFMLVREGAQAGIPFHRSGKT